MRNNRVHATFLIHIEWKEDQSQYMTAQMARDKLIVPMQELWLTHVIDKLSIDEITKPKTTNKLTHKDEKGLRKPFSIKPQITRKKKAGNTS